MNLIKEREVLRKSKRIVIKVGTSTLTHSTGRMNLLRMDKLAMVISELMNQGKEIVLVSSGAIGVGMGKLNLKEKPNSIGWKQALAAVGQCELMNIYSKLFSTYNHIVAQILLTKAVLDNEINSQNVVNTFENLLNKGILPIVNENDTVSVEEIESMETFGDNDTLSALVSILIKADLLIILTDTDGFYAGNPKENPSCELFTTITEITPEIKKYAGGVGTSRGVGGMLTKINAAETATNSGINVVITNGVNPKIIVDILHGKDIGTFFSANNIKNTL